MDYKTQLKSFFTEHWKYLAVNAACKLNLFEALIKPKTLQELKIELGIHGENLETLLSALCNLNFLKNEGGLFSLTPLSELLTENNSDSLKFACMNWAEEHLIAWQNLDFAIKNDRSTFEHLYGDTFFNYLNDHPDKLDNYHKAMFEYARDDYENLSSLIDFSKHDSILDCGGGYGAIIGGIKQTNPNLECYLFDLPNVVQRSSLHNVIKLGGDFFESIPQVADAIILSRILHDWDDCRAEVILKNCNKALPNDGTLYVIENCSDNIDIDLSLLSLNMATLCKSKERTYKEYKHLCEKQGFELIKTLKLNQLQSILVFRKL